MTAGVHGPALRPPSIVACIPLRRLENPNCRATARVVAAVAAGSGPAGTDSRAASPRPPRLEGGHTQRHCTQHGKNIIWERRDGTDSRVRASIGEQPVGAVRGSMKGRLPPLLSAPEPMVRHASCAWALSVSLLCTSALAGRAPFEDGVVDFAVKGGEPGPRGAPATSDLRDPSGVHVPPADLSSGDCEDQVKGTDTRSRVLTSGQKLKLLPSDQDSKYDYVNYYIYVRDCGRRGERPHMRPAADDGPPRRCCGRPPPGNSRRTR